MRSNVYTRAFWSILKPVLVILAGLALAAVVIEILIAFGL